MKDVTQRITSGTGSTLPGAVMAAVTSMITAPAPLPSGMNTRIRAP